MGDLLGLRYPQLLRTPGYRWWKPVLGLGLVLVVLVVLGVGVVFAASLLRVVTGAQDPFSENALSPATPLGLLANNLAIAMILPAVLLAVVAVHRERPGLLSSVACRLRWGVLLRLLPLALLVVVAFFGLGLLVPPKGVGQLDPPGAATVTGLLAVTLATTPLQAAAEEYGFRGYLTQAVGAWFTRPAAAAVVAAGVSAPLFALAHGGQDAWLFGDRLAFGLVASWLAWRTGGLEAPVALHVTNNLVSLGWGAVAGSLEEALTMSELEWPYAVLDVTMMLVFAVVVDRLIRRWRPAVRRVPSPGPAHRDALSGPMTVGYPVPPSDAPRPAGSDNPWGMG